MAIRDAIRNLIPARLKTGLARALCANPVGRLIGAVYADWVPRDGFRFATPTPPVSPEIKATIFWGIYESAEIRFVGRLLRGDVDVVELGASLGVVSCSIARKLSPVARLICVEANPALASVWRDNMKRNAPTTRADLRQLAIDCQANGGETWLSVEESSDASRLGDRGLGIRVPASSLSALLARERVDRYALVCDIEGAEAGVIFDDANALAGCQQIIAELHDTEHRGRRFAYGDLAVAIEKLGFRRVAEYGAVYAFEREA